MKIFGIMLIKNEIDVIEALLLDAKSWADRIFILDNGSDDGTWEKVQSMADEVIVPWKQDRRMYSNALRGDVYNAFKHEASDGDWWCFSMDSDEFYIQNPRDFLAKVPKKFHVVQKKSIDYFLSPEDVEEYDFTGHFLEDRDKIRYIKPVAWSEARFFRHRDRMTWPEGKDYPKNSGIRAPDTILARHYQCRSPQQMQKRLDLRNAIPKNKSGKPFKHITQTDWRELLIPRDQLVLDEGQKTYDALPLKNKAKDSLSTYMIKRVLHGLRIWP